MKDKVFMFFMLAFFMWAIVGEYQDHGWKGVAIILVGAVVLYAILHAGIEHLARKGRDEGE